jgi:hypothetical protein
MSELTGRSPFPTRPNPVDRLRSNAKVRAELYAFWTYQKAVQQYHIAAWESSDGHPEECDVCKRMSLEQRATVDLIRIFGGKPRL